MEQKIKKKYNELKDKYSLPDFDEINPIFSIYKIENEDFLLKQIRKKIIGKTTSMSEILENFLHPDTTLSDIYECKVFSDLERDRIFKLYKNLKILEKESIELSLEPDEKTEAEFIKNVWNSWDNIKQEMLFFIRKVKEFWKSELPKSKIEGYFG
ncbi:MAG: hypothetical protein KKF74_01520 [Nanoarchaeota archaeon]|nr:hypothetical protein [Nanoarchaeota archaeon]